MVSDDRWGERIFEREAWAALRAHEPVPIAETDLDTLAGINEELSLDEVRDVFVPLARLIHLRAGLTRALHDATGAFLGRFRAHAPFVVGVAGSVAVGKSTTSRVLQAVLGRAPEHRRVDLVTTDGFLYPNAELERRGLMSRKGFPESYDTAALVRFLAAVKAGQPELAVPVYDHSVYDVVAGGAQVVDRPEILIVEGLNVLQVPPSGPGMPAVFVSDFFDLSVYVDAEVAHIEAWYLERFLTLVEAARDDADAFFHRFAGLSEDEASALAHEIWSSVNLPNLEANVLPTRDRADIVLEKGADHGVERVRMRLR